MPAVSNGREYYIGRLAFDVFAMLADNEEDAYPTGMQKRLADERGDNAPSKLEVSQALKLLEELGLVRLRRHETRVNGRRVKMYELTAKAGFNHACLGW